MTAAIVIFALTEDSIFYFSSVSPYALAVFLQLATLHLLLSMNGKASVRLALALEAVLTAAYLLRINLILFIARALAIVWVRAGGDRWRVYAASAGPAAARGRSVQARSPLQGMSRRVGVPVVPHGIGHAPAGHANDTP